MSERPGWSDDLVTGNPVIDELHKEIFRRADILLDKIKAGGVSDDEIRDTVEFLSDYVVEHFGVEEALQKLYKYPAFESHKEKHDRLTLDVGALKDNYEAGLSDDLAAEIANFIITWLVDDLEMDDKALADYIRKMAA